MTGHHIYTRSWYEFGSRSKSPGTFTVELTDGLFAPNASEVIYQRLNPKFAGTQPSIAGYSAEQSLLRLFHPTADSTVVSRSYFVNDEVTGRGVVQYSFGLVFMRDASEKLLNCPKRAFELDAFEPYSEFVKRVAEDGMVAYSAAYDPKPGDYDAPLRITRDNWVDLGFDEETFIKFFVSLGKAVAPQKGEHKVAAVLPADSDGEALILAALSILPPWLRRKFGAASRWSGAMDGGTAAIGGMQLVCYVGEKPPYEATDAVIDLTGAGGHKNIEPITEEQQDHAKWYWDNIDNPDVLEKSVKYLSVRYKHLMDKMPFHVYAHCFWLWLTFYESIETGKSKIGDLDFKTASRAISSLVSAFGRDVNDFFKDINMLGNIFRAYIDNFEVVGGSEVSVNVVRAICVLASGDVEIKMGGIKTRDLVKPLFDKLHKSAQWGGLKPIMQYYAKILKDEKPEAIVNEALISTVYTIKHCSDKGAVNEAAAALKHYANAALSSALAGGHKARAEEYKALYGIIDATLKKKVSAALSGPEGAPAGGGALTATEQNTGIYMMIALLLKKTEGQGLGVDVASWEGAPENEDASRAFYRIEKFNRENIANARPPDNNKLDRVTRGVQWLPQEEIRDVLKALLGIYWNSDELKDAARKRAYIRHLHEGKKLPLFTLSGAGTDDIREVYKEELDKAFDGRRFNSADERIAELSKWWHVLSDQCGFPESDPIFDHYDAKFAELDGIMALSETMSPEAGKQLLAVLQSRRSDSFRGHQIALALITTLDEIAENKGEFSATFQQWDSAPAVLDMRMGYWLYRAQEAPPEWALSKAILKAKINNIPLNDYRVTSELFLNYRGGERGYKQDLISLYEALRIIGSENRYGKDTPMVYGSVKAMVGIILDKLWQDDSIELLLRTAERFKSLLFSGYQGNPYAVDVGRTICATIKAFYREKNSAPPDGVLQKFDPYERRAITRQNPVESMLRTALLAALIVGALCCAVIHLTSAGGYVRTMLAIVPELLIAVMALSAVLLVVYSLLEVLGRFKTRGRR